MEANQEKIEENANQENPDLHEELKANYVDFEDL
jgi:hypothetical protein